VEKNCKTHFKLGIIAHVNRLILVICASLTAAMAAVSPSDAETLSFSEHNFSIELPANWSRSDVKAPAVVGARNADGTKAIVVLVAATIPERERSRAAAQMVAGAKDSMKEKGWAIIGERQVTNNGLVFDTFTARMSDAGTMTTWVISVNDKAYSLTGVWKSGDASADPELQSVLGSFRFLSSVSQNTTSAQWSSIAYRIGYMLGPILLLAVLAGGVIMLVRRSRRRAVMRSDKEAS
jgi:predicted Zn-dependent protease